MYAPKLQQLRISLLSGEWLRSRMLSLYTRLLSLSVLETALDCHGYVLGPLTDMCSIKDIRNDPLQLLTVVVFYHIPPTVFQSSFLFWSYFHTQRVHCDFRAYYHLPSSGYHLTIFSNQNILLLSSFSTGRANSSIRIHLEQQF